MEVIKAVAGPFAVNCYIVYRDDREDCVIIDPGADPSLILKTAGNRSPAACLLTHGHFDHIGALTAAAFLDIPVYLHPSDSVYLRDPALNVSEQYPPLITLPLKPRPTQEGDAEELAGLRFETLHTPGHTPGSVCYRCENHLFTGDTLFRNGYGATDFPGGNFHDLCASLRRLLRLRENLFIHPGHGEECMFTDIRRS
ncbi:MAG: MBL fold metallo-hydrolase [Clostridia bacterium]|nr:MBL fold metallo-hydrolase [Clostridia bacterium]